MNFLTVKKSSKPFRKVSGSLDSDLLTYNTVATAEVVAKLMAAYDVFNGREYASDSFVRAHEYIVNRKDLASRFGSLQVLLNHVDESASAVVDKQYLESENKTLKNFFDSNKGIQDYFIVLKEFQEGLSLGNSNVKDDGLSKEYFVAQGPAYTAGFLASFNGVANILLAINPVSPYKNATGALKSFRKKN